MFVILNKYLPAEYTAFFPLNMFFCLTILKEEFFEL